MGLFLGGTNLLTAGTTGGSGGTGGGIPETEIFTSTGRWFVPQSVQDEIASEGHAEVGIFMVGGGGATNGGEIVNQLIQLTTNDYDDPLSTSPSITVVVGATGGHTGLTEQVISTFTQTLISPNQLLVAQPISVFPVLYPVGNSGTPLFGPNGFPMISSLQAPPEIFRLSGVSTVAGTAKRLDQANSVFTWSGTTQPDTIDATNGTMTWSAPVEFDGTLAMTYYATSGDAQEEIILTTTYSQAQIRYETVRTKNSAAGPTGADTQAQGQSGGGFGTFELQIQDQTIAIRQARSGDNGASSQFLNNPSSSEGYYGGFSRVGSSDRPNSGQPGQGGYLQIFYN